MVLYAILQEVFCAHAFWQGLWAMRKYFMPYGKKYSGHMPFGKGSGQCNSTGTKYFLRMELYAFQRRESLAYAFTARALDKNLDYAFVSLKYMSVLLLTLCPPPRRWRKTQANFRMHQKRQCAKKVPAAQSYFDGGGAQALQCGYPRCAAACTADACNAAAA